MWTEWKLDYLKRHIQQKSHLKAVGIVRRLKMGQEIGTLLQESAKDRGKRNELSHKTKSDPEQTLPHWQRSMRPFSTTHSLWRPLTVSMLNSST